MVVSTTPLNKSLCLPVADPDGVPLIWGKIAGLLDQWQIDPRHPSVEYRDALAAVMCPACGGEHLLPWPAGEGLGVMIHFPRPCPDPISPLNQAGVLVALDPDAEHAIDIGERPERKRVLGVNRLRGFHEDV